VSRVPEIGVDVVRDPAREPDRPNLKLVG
jgi:hypothetical protein